LKTVTVDPVPVRGWRRYAVALVLLALCGCAAPATDRVSHPATAIPTGSVEETAQPSTSPQPARSSITPAPPVQIRYRMNESYSFDPIDPSAPADVVLLTFDDGPSEAGLLTSILDTLDRHGAKAVFFVNGYRAQPHPELLRLIADRGHAIGNHSWDHVNLKKLGVADVAQQITDLQILVSQVVGTAPRFFRPPHGAGNDTVKQIAAEQGLLYMTWSDGSLDWDGSTQGRPDLVVANVLAQLHPGANVLMHELPRTAEALDPLLTQLEQRGYGFLDPASIEHPS
jgi:peptidoglycan-N-acetylglucosamine deacetylase